MPKIVKKNRTTKNTSAPALSLKSKSSAKPTKVAKVVHPTKVAKPVKSAKATRTAKVVKPAKVAKVAKPVKSTKIAKKQNATATLVNKTRSSTKTRQATIVSKETPPLSYKSSPLKNGKALARRRERLKRFRRLMRYEIANLITHGIGLGLSIAGLVFLLIRPEPVNTGLHLVSFAIYGSSMITVYLASTLYHSLLNPRLKKAFRVLDHSSIFIAIAGTYTPVALLVLQGKWGWPMFGLIWGVGLIGIAYKVFARRFVDYIDITFYIATGWLLMVAIKPTYDAMAAAPFALMVIGGAFYTLGTIFYALSKMAYHHMVWHLFVLAGSLSHFIMIYLYV